jgi:transposase
MKKLEIDNSDIITAKAKMYLNKDAEIRFMQRVQIIQYLAENKDQSCIDAGRLFNVSPKAILKWIKKVNETGDLETLREKPGRGRKTRLTKEQVIKIEKAVKGKPQKVGIKAEQWTGELLAQYVTEKLGVEMQARQCQRILQKLGVSNQRGRPIDTPEL